MKRDVKLTRLLKSALLLLAFCLSAMTCTGVGTAEAAPQQITMSIAQWNSLKQETNLLEAKIADSERYVSDAEKHVERADATISRSEVTAKRNEESTEQLQKLISECQTIVRRQQGIIQDIDRANGVRTQESEKN